MLTTACALIAIATQGRMLYADGRPAVGGVATWVIGSFDAPRVWATAKADAQGRFVFAAAPPRRNGEPSVLLFEAPNAGMTVLQPFLLEVRPDVYLRPPTALRLPVRDAAGYPVVGTSVTIRQIDLRNGFAYVPPQVAARYRATTNAQGVAVVRGLPQDALVVPSVSGDYGGVVSSLVPLSGGTTSDAVPLLAVRTATVVGRLSRPVSNALVSFRSDHGLRLLAKIDARGAFRLKGLVPGTYTLTLRSSGDSPPDAVPSAPIRFSVAEGETRSIPTVAVSSGAMLRGRLSFIGSDAPMTGQSVRVASAVYPESDPLVARTDDEGRWALRVPAGENAVSLGYTAFVKVDAPLGATVFRDRSFPEWKTPAAPSTEGVRVRVVLPDGRPAPYAEVTVEGAYAFTGSPTYRTDAGGELRLSDFEAPASSTFRARSGAFATPNGLTRTTEKTIRLTLAAHGLGALTGRVVDPQGRPLGGVAAVLIEKRSQIGVSRAVALTDAKGRYRFEGLWPDALYGVGLEGDGWSGVYLEEGRVAAGTVDEREEVRLAAATGVVKGQVVDAEGKPVAAAIVSLGTRHALADPQGRFRFERVGPGRASVGVQAEGRHAASTDATPGADLRIVLLPDAPRAVAEAPKSRTMPELNVADLDGKPIRLADLRGKIVVLDFWGTDCGPCVGALPGVQRLWEAYGRKGVVVVGIHHSGTSAKEVRAFAQTHGLTYALGVDAPGAGFGATCSAYGVSGIPSIAVLDRRGETIATDVSVDEAFQKVGEALAAEKR